MEYFIYNINNLTPQAYNKWYSLVTKEKKSRIDRMRHGNDKKRSVAGEMLIKSTIAQICGIATEDIVIKASPNGKPYIEGLPIHFNISHCEDLVVCAVHTEPVGIDIEKIRPINLKIAKRFFNEDEQTYLFGKPPLDEDYNAPLTYNLLKRFFEVWTAKEAYLKFTGEGIVADLNKLHFTKANIETHYTDDFVISIYTEK